MATRTLPSDNLAAKAEQDAQASASLESAVGAAFIAGGIGSLVLGLAVVGAETNASIKTFFTWNSGVGPLSGKTGVSIIAFIVSWVILHYVMRNRVVSLTTSFIICLVLTVVGLLLTFPPVFFALAGE
jgi:hypothetical protein